MMPAGATQENWFESCALKFKNGIQFIHWTFFEIFLFSIFSFYIEFRVCFFASIDMYYDMIAFEKILS